jgi:hypothetical protein
MLIQLANKGVHGDLRAIRDILTLAGAIEQQEPANPAPLVVKIIRYGDENSD